QVATAGPVDPMPRCVAQRFLVEERRARRSEQRALLRRRRLRLRGELVDAVAPRARRWTAGEPRGRLGAPRRSGAQLEADGDRALARLVERVAPERTARADREPIGGDEHLLHGAALVAVAVARRPPRRRPARRGQVDGDALAAVAVVDDERAAPAA